MSDTLPPLPPPAAQARWWEQNAVSATQLALLREHSEVSKYWGNRDKLDLYTADQMREYAALARAPCKLPECEIPDEERAAWPQI